ncbi:DUF58 domain-containing protein [Bacillus infantis]|uniref:DUF58 domain-containing protein n=1 Tax=Bacillus infantis TaxID=324767 RepID=UPI003CE87A07
MKQLIHLGKNVWKLIVLFLLILTTFSYAMFQGGFVSWFLFYSFLPFALYGLALSFYSVGTFRAERDLVKTDYNAGEKLKVKVTLKRDNSFPLFFLIAEDCLNEALSFSSKGNKAKSFVFPWFKREVSFEYEVDGLPRGEHIFENIRLKTGDPIGLIEKEKLVELEGRIIVYPAYEELIYKPADNHYDQGMTASKERVQRDTSMAVGIREYQPGDRFSWINWKATARRNDIMTKEFEQRKSHDVYIMMDCAPDERFEGIVSFTASVIRGILRKGAQTGLITMGAERAAFPVRGGEGQQQQLFYHLAKVKDDCPVSFDRVLETENFLAQQNVSLMLITAQLTKRLVEKASYYASHKNAVTIFLLKNEREAAAKEEIALRASANARGVKVVLVHEGQFSEAFSEVNRG